MRNGSRKSWVIAVSSVLVLMAWESSAAAAARAKVITARAGILLDNRDGRVLWEHNPDTPLPPASTTKVVTATLALQSGMLDESFRVTPNAAQEPPSKVYLRAGWEVELEDLVYAILLNSANDASVVIAEGMSGSVPAFAARMNMLAYNLGAENSSFVNPNGLPADGHLSTARDLTTLFRHGLKIPKFRKVLQTSTRTIQPTSGGKTRIALRSKNRLLKDYRYRVIGKTGWTRAAKKCFVGMASSGGREVVFAILGSDDLWGDVRRLVEYGFEGGVPPQPKHGSDLRMARATTPNPPASAAPVAAGDDDDAARAPGGRYYVRVATYRSARDAQRMKTNLRGDGFPAEVFRILQNGRALYRVSVGGFPNRKSATKTQSLLRKHHPRLQTTVVAS